MEVKGGTDPESYGSGRHLVSRRLQHKEVASSRHQPGPHQEPRLCCPGQGGGSVLYPVVSAEGPAGDQQEAKAGQNV